MKAAEIINFGTFFVPLKILVACWKDVQSRDWETRGSTAIAFDMKVKKFSKNERF